jgi:uncharacterized membrane protein
MLKRAKKRRFYALQSFIWASFTLQKVFILIFEKIRLMEKNRLFMIICVICAIMAIFSLSSSAAIIHGTIYDLGLDKVENAVVGITTLPKQQYVAKNSTYSFNVSPGEYALTARQYSGSALIASASENVTIGSEGEYVIDLILFPSFDEEEAFLEEAEFEIDTSELVYEGPGTLSIVVFLLAIATFFIILRMRGNIIKKGRDELEKAEKESDLSRMVAFIKKEGGRTTQKEIRKNFPQSEAKISLILTELEDRGRIKKIKKGRGNVIILQ